MTYKEAKRIASGCKLKRDVSVPYDNDYANNEHAHFWVKLNSEEECEAFRLLYGRDSDFGKVGEWYCVEDDENTMFSEEILPGNIKKYDKENHMFRSTSFQDAKKAWEELVNGLYVD